MCPISCFGTDNFVATCAMITARYTKWQTALYLEFDNWFSYFLSHEYETGLWLQFLLCVKQCPEWGG